MRVNEQLIMLIVIMSILLDGHVLFVQIIVK